VQSIGPSPVVIHRQDLEAIAKTWEQTAVALKTDQAADAALGWVIEMWGYAIAAAKHGLRHQEFPDFQVEPGALSTSRQLNGVCTAALSVCLSLSLSLSLTHDLYLYLP